MRSLNKLLSQTGIAPKLENDVSLFGVTDDSRSVEYGYLFVAIDGVAVDGAAYIQQAIDAGAGAILVRAEKAEEAAVSVSIPVIPVADDRIALAKIAAAFYAPQPAKVVGVTGTNGKSSVVSFYRQLVSLAGEKAAAIGTLGVDMGDAECDAKFPAVNTSPGAVLLHKTLQQCSQEKIDYVAIEASSHGLHQHRMDGVEWCSAAFTNLSHDHLDYHGSMEAYFDAKARLFSEGNFVAKRCVVNADDAYSEQMMSLCQRYGFDVISYGKNGADFYVQSLDATASGMRATVMLFGDKVELELPLFGAFQLGNILAALGLAYQSGIEMEQLVPHLSILQSVRGRLEHVGSHHDAPIFVDYAHTPDALKQVLVSLREHTDGALHVVFGCGGDRDKAKRGEMGAIADEYADGVLVTDDNPRSEEAATIRSEIIKKCPNAQEIGDRKEAIFAAVAQLKKGDVLVIAGKGHETYQEIAGQRFEFNDAEVIREAIAHG